MSDGNSKLVTGILLLSAVEYPNKFSLFDLHGHTYAHIKRIRDMIKDTKFMERPCLEKERLQIIFRKEGQARRNYLEVFYVSNGSNLEKIPKVTY